MGGCWSDDSRTEWGLDCWQGEGGETLKEVVEDAQRPTRHADTQFVTREMSGKVFQVSALPWEQREHEQAKVGLREWRTEAALPLSAEGHRIEYRDDPQQLRKMTSGKLVRLSSVSWEEHQEQLKRAHPLGQTAEEARAGFRGWASEPRIYQQHADHHANGAHASDHLLAYGHHHGRGHSGHGIPYVHFRHT